ncbi:probable DNA replication complex GINS protein PSF2 [Ctenocephalides felis]|uniref:probable DNA replication complex GINS protein PSF2 n=1 Tax=Ctenocephalides felis TaxID=7515 RepID=UPI000E6E55D3|nr:probable DNA replication complex GINS protein PSF2 [Ctenocephalides felis]
MDPAEVEFLAEKETIEVIPNFSFDPVHLISGSIGPFKAGLPLNVPLWLAVTLRQQQKCRFVTPEWMDVTLLEEVREEEKQSRFFTKMPNPHYMVEAKLILNTAAEDIPRAEEIRTIIKDIWDIRMAKLRTSMDAFIREGGSYAKLDHLTAMEINSVRPLLPHALDQLFRLQMVQKSSNTTQNSTLLSSFSSKFTS